MLVLRRRPQEALVFDGGLTLTLLSVIDRQAWLGLEGPEITPGVAVGVLAVAPETVCLGIRSPAEVRREVSGVTSVTLGAPGDDSVLLLNAGIGSAVDFEGLRLTVASVEDGRALLGLATPCLATPVAISVVSVSVAEARIGVDAPGEIRVYRREVWLEMQAANRGAAAEWSAADLAALAGDRSALAAEEPALAADQLVRSDDERN